MSGGRVCHFKLVLLGDAGVGEETNKIFFLKSRILFLTGKSCIVVRFVRDEFFDFQEPTIGGII